MYTARILSRALLALGILFVGAATEAHADYMVNAKFTGVSPSQVTYFSTNAGKNWTGTLAGNYNWSNATGTGTSLLGNSFSTFCIEVVQNVAQNTNYDYRVTSDIASLPKNSMPGGMGAVKAQKLGYLLNAFKTGALNGILPAVSPMLEAVLQATVWNIVYDTDANTVGGQFRVNSQSNSSSTAFSTYINAVLTNVNTFFSTYNALTAQYAILGLTNDSYQDQIVVVDHNTYMNAIAPVPPGIILAGTGIMLVGGFSLLRRRKTTGTANG